MVDRRQVLVAGGAVATIGAATVWSGMRKMGTPGTYASAMEAARAPLPADPATADLIRFATLAASGHNTQPWQFDIEGDSIVIVPDLTRRTPVVDPDDHHLWVGLGCAAENLILAAASRGKPGAAVFDRGAGGSIRVSFTKGASADAALSDAITQRQSTRAVYDGTSVPPADLAALARAASLPGVDMTLITDRARIDLIRDLVIAGNTNQLTDPAFLRELKRWLRFNPQAATRAGDGLYSATTGNPALPDWLGPRMFDLTFTPKAENEKYAAQIASSSGFAVFTGAKADAEHWVLAGHACQRFALQATALGLKHAFLNQPVEVAGLRPDLAAIIGLPGRRPDLVMRFGHGPVLPFSPRRPVDEVMVVQVQPGA